MHILGAMPTNERDNPRSEPAPEASSQDKPRSRLDTLAQRASETVRTRSEQSKERAALEIHQKASGLERSADVLEEEGQATLGNLTRRLAREIDRASTSLENQSLSGFLSDAERVARERPALALGVAAFAGFALSRFLSSASSGRREAVGDPGYEGYQGYEGFEPLEPSSAVDIGSSPSDDPHRSKESLAAGRAQSSLPPPSLPRTE